MVKITNVVNLTPHAVTVRVVDAEIVFPPTGKVARVEMVRTECGQLDLGRKDCGNIPVCTCIPGPVTGLPDPQDGVRLIVSAMVRVSLPTRGDLLSPADFIRDAIGNIVACRSFDSN